MIPSSNPTNINLKIVIDTNLFVSVFAFHGQMVNHIFDLVINGKLFMYFSPALRREIQKKFVFFKVSEETTETVLEFVQTKGVLLEPSITIDEARDNKDNFLLELSEAANAHYLITRDEDLLILKTW